ncbi:hypothetical protein M427DRAFT_144115 [Gonapodya prolifera JEL478]|uniref:Spindle pole body component n=1 Tax=Gonapodya prolifera (strain JEL478) TaxID=1344416 RepID=A0A139ALK9_GONPJ|nr:hypothetical protein M427DRAFT_144115 [Gonapodya prolifera JEL478]|eukprot:KXS17661.1 hypothetical protein M427DRAFT_144115 [Gonapodya prolifera JEL478]
MLRSHPSPRMELRRQQRRRIHALAESLVGVSSPVAAGALESLCAPFYSPATLEESSKLSLVSLKLRLHNRIDVSDSFDRLLHELHAVPRVKADPTVAAVLSVLFVLARPLTTKGLDDHAHAGGVQTLRESDEELYARLVGDIPLRPADEELELDVPELEPADDDFDTGGIGRVGVEDDGRANGANGVDGGSEGHGRTGPKDQTTEDHPPNSDPLDTAPLRTATPSILSDRHVIFELILILKGERSLLLASSSSSSSSHSHSRRPSRSHTHSHTHSHIFDLSLVPSTLHASLLAFQDLARATTDLRAVGEADARGRTAQAWCGVVRAVLNAWMGVLDAVEKNGGGGTDSGGGGGVAQLRIIPRPSDPENGPTRCYGFGSTAFFLPLTQPNPTGLATDLVSLHHLHTLLSPHIPLLFAVHRICTPLLLTFPPPLSSHVPPASASTTLTSAASHILHALYSHAARPDMGTSASWTKMFVAAVRPTLDAVEAVLCLAGGGGQVEAEFWNAGPDGALTLSPHTPSFLLPLLNPLVRAHATASLLSLPTAMPHALHLYASFAHALNSADVRDPFPLRVRFVLEGLAGPVVKTADEAVWKAVVGARYVEFLGKLFDVALMLDGNFAAGFVASVSHLIETRVATVDEVDLNRCLYAHVPLDMVEIVHITLAPAEDEARNNAWDVLGRLRLKVHVPFPFTFLIPSESVAILQTTFSFALHVRYAQRTALRGLTNPLPPITSPTLSRKYYALRLRFQNVYDGIAANVLGAAHEMAGAVVKAKMGSAEDVRTVIERRCREFEEGNLLGAKTAAIRVHVIGVLRLSNDLRALTTTPSGHTHGSLIALNAKMHTMARFVFDSVVSLISHGASRQLLTFADAMLPGVNMQM